MPAHTTHPRFTLLRSLPILTTFIATAAPAGLALADDLLAKWTFETTQPTSGGSDRSGYPAEQGAYGSISFARGGHINGSVYSSPVGNGSAHSYSSTTWSVGDWYQFAVCTFGYNNLSIKWDQASSNTGPRDFKLMWSADGVNFAQFGATYTVPANAAPNQWTPTSAYNPLFTFGPVPLPAAAANLPVVYIRTVMASTTSANGGTVGSAGTDRVEDVTFTGTPIPAVGDSVFHSPADGVDATWLSFDQANNPVVAFYSGLANWDALWATRVGGAWRLASADGPFIMTGISGFENHRGPVTFAASPSGAVFGAKSVIGPDDEFIRGWTYNLSGTQTLSFYKFWGHYQDCVHAGPDNLLRIDASGALHSFTVAGSIDGGCGCHLGIPYYDGVPVFDESAQWVTGYDWALGPDGAANLILDLHVPCNQPGWPVGTYHIRKDASGFSAPHPVFLNNGFTISPHVAIDQYSGKIHLAAVFGGPGGAKVLKYLSSTDNGQTWSTPVQIAPFTTSGRNISIALTPDGTPSVVFWSGFGHMQFAEQSSTGDWCPRDVLVDSPIGDYNDALKMAYDNTGAPYVFFFSRASHNYRLMPVPPSLYTHAEAGPDQVVPEDSLVTLDASASTGPGGSTAALSWTQTAGPAVSLNLGNPTHPTFVSPDLINGSALLTFRLDVAGGSCNPGVDYVNVTVTNVNQPPVAYAGADQTVPEGTLVTLDGSLSYDPDNDSVQLLWTQVSGPSVQLNQTDPAHPTFTSPLVAGGAVTLSFRIDVSDGVFAPSADYVDITVTNVNHAPIAYAGPDQTVPEDTLVVLDATQSSDPDNDVLSVSWTQTAGPAVQLDLTDLLHPTFTAPFVSSSGTTLTFRLDINDGAAPTVSDSVSIAVTNVNHVPVASAGSDQSVPEAALVTLDGSGSSDPDNDPIFLSWVQVAGPAVQLDQSNPYRPTFVAPFVPRGGATLTFRLDVSDGLPPASQAVVNITVTNVNHAPEAIAGPDQAVAEGSPVVLDGSLSFDLDNDVLSFEWIQTSGQWVYLDLTDPARPTFQAPPVARPGEVVGFTLIVDDGLDTAMDTVNIVVENVNHLPIANAGPDASYNEGVYVSLSGSASSDPDSDPLTFTWQQFAGPAVILSDPSSPTPSFTAPQVGPAGVTLAFRLFVDDGIDSTSDTMTMFIKDTATGPDCSKARPSADELWPPNHKMVSIKILGVVGSNSDPVTITILGVTQDEPINGLGDGDTGPDASIQGSTVLLRSERSGLGNGRVYRISFRASSSGGQCTGSVAVCVPHDQSPHHQCIDDGQRYNSLGN